MPIQSIFTRYFRTQLCKTVTSLFDQADFDDSGNISFLEANELILRIWIDLEPPITPPSRKTAKLLFDQADKDGKGTLNRDEFRGLIFGLMQRASLRMTIHSIFSYVVSPWLAWKVVKVGSELEWEQYKLIGSLFAILPEKGVALLKSEDFWKASLTMLFFETLGKQVLKLSRDFYDENQLVGDDSSDSSSGEKKIS